MSNLFLLGLICVIPIIAIVLAEKNRRDKLLRDNARVCLTSLTTLKALLIYIQRHRGLTTGSLHGDASLRGQIQQVASKIDSLWQTTEHDFPAIAEEPLYEGIYSHWQRLNRHWQNQTVGNNIDQHSRLITNLLYLIENQAESNALLIKYGRETGLDVIWKELLETIEAVGQVRAIGMGVVSSGNSSAIERIQLKFLIDKVLSRLSTLNEALLKDSPCLINKEWSKPLISQANEKTNSLFGFIESSMLRGQLCNVSSETFFGLATSAIEPLDSLFNKASNEISLRYENK